METSAKTAMNVTEIFMAIGVQGGRVGGVCGKGKGRRNLEGALSALL